MVSTPPNLTIEEAFNSSPPEVPGGHAALRKRARIRELEEALAEARRARDERVSAGKGSAADYCSQAFQNANVRLRGNQSLEHQLEEALQEFEQPEESDTKDNVSIEGESSESSEASDHAPQPVLPVLPVYVLIPPSPLFAAHWSLFIPNTEDSNLGRRIHVAGDRLNGFKLEIIRGYDVSLHRNVTPNRRFLIGITLSMLETETRNVPRPASKHKQKDEDEGGGYVHNFTFDGFEETCMEVQAPGPSLNHVSSESGNPTGKRQKTEVKDCQWWVRQVVELLYRRRILRPIPSLDGDAESSPVAIVGSLPVH